MLGIPHGLQGMNGNREITHCHARGALKGVPEYLGKWASLTLINELFYNNLLFGGYKYLNYLTLMDGVLRFSYAENKYWE